LFVSLVGMTIFETVAKTCKW